MGSCGGLIAVDEPSGVDKEPGSEVLVGSEQAGSLKNDSVESCGISVKESFGCASLGDETVGDLSNVRGSVDEQTEKMSQNKESSAGDFGVEDAGGRDPKCSGISANENSGCVIGGDETGVRFSDVSESVEERDKEEVLGIEKMYQNKDPFAGDSGVEGAGGVDAKCRGVSAKENSGCVTEGNETGVHLSDVSESVDERDKEEVLGIEKMYQNKESSAGDSRVEDAGELDAKCSAKENTGCATEGDEAGVCLSDAGESVDEWDKDGVLGIEKMYQNMESSVGASRVEDAGGLDANNTGEGCCLKGGSRLSENELGITLETSEVGRELVSSSGSERQIMAQDANNDKLVVDKDNVKIVSGIGTGLVVEAESRSDIGACASILHSQTTEIAGESSLKTGSPDHCAQSVQQKDSENMVSALDKVILDGNHDDSTEIEAVVPLLMLQLQDCQMTPENSGYADLGGNYTLENEQSVEKTEGPSEGVKEIPENSRNTVDDTDAGFCLPASPLAGSACRLKEDLSETTLNFINKKLDIPDEYDAVRVFTGEINSSSVTEACGKLDHNKEGIVIVNHVSELKCPGVLSSSSRRSSKGSEASQKNQTREGTRDRTNRTVLHHNEMEDTIFKFQRRKRSCLSKLACSSIWGSMDYVTKNFGLGIEACALRKKDKLPAAMDRRVSKKCSSKGAGRSRKDSSQRPRASSALIRLKVKFGKEVAQKGVNTVVPDAADAQIPTAALYDPRNYLSSMESTVDNLKSDGQVAEKLKDNETEKQVLLLEKSTLRVEQSSDASNLDTHHANKDLDVSLVLCNSAEDIAGDHLEIHSNIVCEGPGPVQNVYVDAGTSPDSEVINVNPEAQGNAKCQEDLNQTVIASTVEFAFNEGVISKKKGKLKGKKSCAVNSSTAGKVNIYKAKSSKKSDKAKSLKKSGIKQQDTSNSSPYKNASSMLPRIKEICAEQSSFMRDTGNDVSGVASTNECVVKNKADLTINVNPGPSQTQSSNDLPYSEKKVPKLCNKLKSDKERKSRKKASNAGSRRRGTGGRQKKNQNRVVNQSKMEEGVVGKMVLCEPESQQETDDAKKIIATENNMHVDASMGAVVPDGVANHYPPQSSAWVSCDDCHKWRRIPHSLLDSIQDRKWVCEDNMDQSFASCLIPQEKSNADINAELGYSDPSCEEDDVNDHLKHRGAGHTVRNDPMKEFKIIRTNEFLHRGRYTQTIDEIMVCHCKPPQDGHLGCGDGCLNRMLTTECVKGTCPCGDLCSNQQFQRRQWAKLGLSRCGKKGYGLKSHQNISEGQFLIEYVGEVLNLHAYEDRQRAYAQEGHKHFYFMTLKGGEVIDACKKGNVGRFINHSCEPNCRTEKWVVNGEVCIGLFALRNIKKGEELTFDYNYVRVFGAAVKKCYCGASQCQGYIGGDPLESEIVQDDSDEEYAEDMTIKEDEEIRVGSGDEVPISNYYAGVDMQNENHSWKKKLQETSAAMGQLGTTTDSDELMDRAACAVSPSESLRDLEGSIGDLVSSQQTLFSTQSDKVASETLPPVPQETPIEAAKTNDAPYCAKISDISLNVKQPTDRNFEPCAPEEKQTLFKPRPRVKTSRTSVKMSKYNNITSGSKVQVLNSKQPIMFAKPKYLVERSACGRFEAVEDIEVKLNGLLDVTGGIKKDAAQGYLKLLLLTASSGDSNNDESIQSNRDLSIILDALLKTKSRAVLTDIINRNGLQMLHNIIKQYRRVFLRIPILRKLMKILEYLSMRSVLTSEHISSGPPCPGMESFRESMLSLTEHVDKQIHQIARNFRDRWIPRSLRKVGCMDKDDSRMDFQKNSKCNRFPASPGQLHINGVRQNETVDCVKQSELATPHVHSVSQEGYSVPCSGESPTNGSKTRKRRSRWDQPDGRDLSSQYHCKEQINGYKVPEPNLLPHQEELMRLDGERNTEEDVPPGFSSPFAHNKISSSMLTSVIDVTQSNVCHQGHSMEATIGHPQDKFISHSPVSYGIPMSVLEQFGTWQNGSVDDWLIAPGIPFSPFPPLPSVPRGKDRLPSSVVNPIITDNMAGQYNNHISAPSGENISSTSGTYRPYMDGPKNHHTHKRPGSFSGDSGRRFFKQQRGPNTRFGPPWLWKRNEAGFMGNNLRNGTFCSTTMNGQSSFSLEDERCREEKAGSNFHQQMQHQNRY